LSSRPLLRPGYSPPPLPFASPISLFYPPPPPHTFPPPSLPPLIPLFFSTPPMDPFIAPSVKLPPFPNFPIKYVWNSYRVTENKNPLSPLQRSPGMLFLSVIGVIDFYTWAFSCNWPLRFLHLATFPPLPYLIPST